MEPESTNNPATTEGQVPVEIIRPDPEVVKPFTEHLEDLRGVLIKSLVAVLITGSVCFYFTESIIRFYEWPLTSLVQSYPQAKTITHHMLRSLHPADAFLVSLKVVAITGLILASPLIFYFIWNFIRPGLKPEERRMAVPVFAGGVVFFLLGIAFCYLVVLRICLGFFYQYSLKMNIQPDWSIDNYISFVSMMMLAFGVVFEMPIVAVLLAKFGLITSSFLSKKRLYAYLAISIVAALLTPPDIFSQILLIIPMIGLYELSILISKIIEKKAKSP